MELQLTARECVVAFCHAWFEQRDIEKTAELLALSATFVVVRDIGGANAFDDDIERCKTAGMNAHLAKPIDPDRLYQTLNDYIFKDEM